jgi:hypothetical protein
MTKLLLASASLIGISTLAHAQDAGVEIRGEAIRVENSTLHCTKCVMTLSQNAKVQVTAEGITADSAGTVTFRGTVRLKLADGEVIAEGGTLTVDSKGAQHFSSDELQFVSSNIR